jgi:hypothetical protein
MHNAITLEDMPAILSIQNIAIDFLNAAIGAMNCYGWFV